MSTALSTKFYALTATLFKGMMQVSCYQHLMHITATFADSEQIATVTASPGWHEKGWYVTITIAAPDGPHSISQFHEHDIESCFHVYTKQFITKSKRMWKKYKNSTIPRVLKDSMQAAAEYQNPFKYTKQ